jgi:hypothetical protein
LGPKKQSETLAIRAAFPRVTDLKKQTQRPGATLPACDGCRPKKQSETLATRAAFPRVTDLKKQTQRPGATLPACDGRRPKKRSETLALRGRSPAGDGPEKTNQLSAIGYQLLACGGLGAAAVKFLLAQPFIKGAPSIGCDPDQGRFI